MIDDVNIENEFKLSCHTITYVDTLARMLTNMLDDMVVIKSEHYRVTA